MTYEALISPRAIRGVPGIAVRLGRALEGWGRRAARPLDREALRLEYARQCDERTRSLDEQRRRVRW